MRKIAFANEKGGVGKTTSTINIGAALASLGHKTLIVDMDSQMNATKGLDGQVDGTGDVYTTYDLMKNFKSLSPQAAVQQTQWSNLFLIPASGDLAGLELELVSQIGREKLLKKSLGALAGLFDFILIDSPPSLSLLTVNIFTYVDEVVIPCQTHPFSFDALGNLFETIEAIQEDINPELKVTGILPTFFDNRTRVSRKVLDQLTTEEKYRQLIFNTPVRTNVTLAESTDVGVPAVFYDGKSRGALDYMGVAKELLNGKGSGEAK